MDHLRTMKSALDAPHSHMCVSSELISALYVKRQLVVEVDLFDMLSSAYLAEGIQANPARMEFPVSVPGCLHAGKESLYR